MKKTMTCTTLLISTLLVGCNNQQAPEAQVETIKGYIYIQGNELMVDEVEIIESKDSERLDELNLEAPSGYAIYNEFDTIDLYTITDETKYIFTDCTQLYVNEDVENRLYETTNINEFIKGSSYQNIKPQDMEEKNYIPYFIEVLDGVVISITEEFAYTI